MKTDIYGKYIVRVVSLLLTLSSMVSFVGAATSSTCSDTDSGFDYLTKGTISGGTWKTSEKTYTDKIDSCAKNGKLLEGFCPDPTHGYYVYKKCNSVVGTGYICSDGACVLDSDNDGIPDSSDLCSGYDDSVDTDSDGTPDDCDCAPDPTSSLIVNVKDEGAKGDGVTDDTAAIQAAVNKVAGTGGTVLVPEGTYMVDAVTSIYLKSNMTFRMTNATILHAIPNSEVVYSILHIRAVSDVTVIDGTVVGDRDTHTGTTGEWGFGIRLSDANNVVVDGVRAADTWGDGFYVGSYTNSEDTSKNITFCSVVADHNRRQGMSITFVDGLVVKNSVFMNTNGTAPGAGIDMEPNENGIVKNVLIQHSQFINNTATTGAILLTGNVNSWFANITIDNNKIIGNEGSGIGIDSTYTTYTTTNTITNNLIKGNKYHGIHLAHGATNNNVIENTVTGNEGHGISDEVGGNTICGNTVFNNTLDSADPSTDMSESYNAECTD